jgi:hypothetical protein
VAGVERFAEAIYIAEAGDTFIGQIEAALRETGDALTQKRLAFGRDNAWPARAEQLWQTWLEKDLSRTI